MRFLIEIARAIRARCGPTFTLSVKLNSADFLRGGFDRDDAVVVARTLSEVGIDLLEISGGTYERPEMNRPTKASSTAREAHFLEYARDIRKVTRCPLMLTGGMRTPAFMSSVVADGSIDVVGLARPLALEPDFPREILAGRTEPSRCVEATAANPRFAAASDSLWHQAQLARMSRGAEPAPTMGHAPPMLRSMWRMLARGVRVWILRRS